MYETKLLKGINLKSENFDIIPEIVFKTTKLNNIKEIREVPYTFDTRVHGKTKRKLKTYLDFFVTLLKLRFS
jgi:dolichol-phosphate mannosyltransferase